MKKHYQNIKIQELPQSEIRIEGEIESSYFDEKFEETLSTFSKTIEIDGFRKGHAPKDLALKQANEVALLEEAARMALEEEYPKIIDEKKLQVLGRPEVVFTTLTRGNNLGFTITVSIQPKISLPNYKKFAQEIHEVKEHEPTEDELNAVVTEIRKQHAHIKMHKSGELQNHDHPPIKESDLENLTDSLVKEFGNFNTVDDFKIHIKENLQKEKEQKSKEKNRMEIIEMILKNTSIDTPKALIESELEKMMAQFEDDIARAGMRTDDYLKHLNKTREDITKEWRDIATKKANIQLIITEIAEKEKIFPDSQTIQNETTKLLTLYKDADPVRARIYVAIMLTNEKVFEFLESHFKKTTGAK